MPRRQPALPRLGESTIPRNLRRVWNTRVPPASAAGGQDVAGKPAERDGPTARTPASRRHWLPGAWEQAFSGGPPRCSVAEAVYVRPPFRAGG